MQITVAEEVTTGEIKQRKGVRHRHDLCKTIHTRIGRFVQKFKLGTTWNKD